MNNELSELRTVLELLKDTVVKTIDSVIPERLQARVVSIIDNCVAVVTKIDDILDRHRGGLGAAKWAVAGKMEIAGLRTGLEAHRQSLHLALELVSITLVKTVKDDTAVIRMEVHDMRENAYQIPEIMQELAKIRAFISGNDSTSAVSGQVYMLQRYLDDLTSYGETVRQDVVWEDTDSKLRLWDNLETFPDISPLYYDAHTILICFNIGAPASLENVKAKWILEITQFCPDTPIFLVGLKSDLRDDHRTIKKLKRSSQQPVSSGDAEACQESIGARKYFECSALTGHGVNELLRSVAQESAATRGVLDKVVRNRRI
ncbi:putative rho gtpase rho1 protein [Eutypa lata UCREL1]|uniref:Putative rho gtpase rho1 protein n=1 Tax=Eutypa lata (strain UCR-EL1) TaxID=1287681 RepID=M7T6Z2_EUTLA|nr:putative rho gtpase rho1 protein [Eutypa lata UCREL1]